MSFIRTNYLSDTQRQLKIALVIFFIGYVAQLGSPLRIDTDSMYYLSVAASFADGHGLNYYNSPGSYPVGYSIVAGGLDVAGLATSTGFIATNLIFLLITIACLRSILSSEYREIKHAGEILVLLFLASFVVVKYFPMPRSETAALAATFSALWSFGRAKKMRGQKRFLFLILGLGSTFIAITIRSVSVAILPVFFWVLMPEQWSSFRILFRNRKMWLLVLGLFLVFSVVTFWIASSTHYLHEWQTQLRDRGLGGQFAFIFGAKLQELGQIATNIPTSLTPKWYRPVEQVFGLVLGGFLIRGLWLRRYSLSHVDIFVIANLFILFIWPGNNPRFWLQVMPFIGGCVFVGIQPFLQRPLTRKLALTFLITYLSIGLAAQTQNARVSYSGSSFPSSYGDGSLEATYRSALHGDELTDNVKMRYFRILLRYESRSSPVWNGSHFVPY